MWEEHLFICVMWGFFLVGFFLTRSHHPKLSTITIWGNTLQNNLQLLTSELEASGVDCGTVLSQKLLRFPQKFEVLAMGWWFRIIIQNYAQENTVSPKLPGSYDKAVDFHKYAKSVRICSRLIYLISHSSIDVYRGLRSMHKVKSLHNRVQYRK